MAIARLNLVTFVADLQNAITIEEVEKFYMNLVFTRSFE